MKKVIFSLAVMLCAANVMVQAQDDKAAAAELKAKTKEANKKVDDAVAKSLEIQTLQSELSAELFKKENGNRTIIDKDSSTIQQYARTYLPQIREGLASGLIKDSKKFQAYKAMDDMATQILNVELTKASTKQDFDLDALANSVFAIQEACHGELTTGNAKDESQKNIMEYVKTKFPKTRFYLAYLCQFYTNKKDYDNAQKALTAYNDFGKNYPEIAENQAVQNPDPEPAMLACIIYQQAFNDKNYEILEKIYPIAIQTTDANNKKFVSQAYIQSLKDRGKTDEWIAALKDLIAKDPTSESAEIAMQQIMSYLNAERNDQVDSYTTELVEKYPQSKVANYCRGFALYLKQKYTDASSFFKKAAEIDPEYSDAVYNCGYCYYQAGLEKARSVSGKNMKSQTAINKAEAEVKQLFKDAQPYFEKIREMEPDKSDRWASPLKTIYKNTGQLAKAKEVEQYSY